MFERIVESLQQGIPRFSDACHLNISLESGWIKSIVMMVQEGNRPEYFRLDKGMRGCWCRDPAGYSGRFRILMAWWVSDLLAGEGRTGLGPSGAEVFMGVSRPGCS